MLKKIKNAFFIKKKLKRTFANVYYNYGWVYSCECMQALVEMSDVTSAQAAVTFYTQRSPLLRGHVIHVQFSNHDQLLSDDAPLRVHTHSSC